MIVVAANQVSADLEGEAVILNLDSGTYFGLNAVGARLWQLVQEPRTLGSVCEVLVAEFDVSAEECERDVRVVLEDMQAQGLVEIR